MGIGAGQATTARPRHAEPMSSRSPLSCANPSVAAPGNAGRARYPAGRILPARQAELLRLLLDVLVVLRGALLRCGDARADLDRDLLEVRPLDRRQELKRRGGRALLEVGQQVGDAGGTSAGSVAPLDQVGTGGTAGLVQRIATLVLATKATNFLAASRCWCWSSGCRGPPASRPSGRSCSHRRQEARRSRRR